MMEPVAWRNEHGAVTNFKHGADAWRDAGIWSEPLVRLSDAEARIAELEARLAEVDKEACDGRVIVGRQKMLMLEAADEITRLTDRAEAAEALLKEAGKALAPFAGYLIPDPDPNSVSGERFGNKPSLSDFRAARAIADKIGVKDE